MKGFKVTEPDGSCRGHLFEVGKTYEVKGSPILCKHGFHFCPNAADCFDYYDFNPKNIVFEVEAVGDLTNDEGNKKATNKIRILRKLEWEEVLKICNTGDSNTGYSNTGDSNTGYRNTGDSNTGNRNTGYRNTGYRNTGNRNTGNSNTGNRNTGNRNTGNSNTGDRNTGDRNTGDWNTASDCSGVFCPKGFEPKIYIFGVQSEMTLSEWRNTEAFRVGQKMTLTAWVESSEMSPEEIYANPTHECTGGYLKKYSFFEACALWWAGLSKEEKALFFDLPNFDPAIFEEITGIKV